MHILILPSWYPTHENPINGIFFREQVHALKNAGHQVGVIYPQLRSLILMRKSLFGWPSGITYEDDDGIPTYGLYGWAWLPLIPRQNINLWLKAGERLFERYVSDHGRPDLLHAHSCLLGGILAARLKERCGISYIITEHSSTYFRGLLPGWQRPLVLEALSKASALVTVSPQLGHLLESNFGDAVHPWVWIPNMVDAAFFSSIRYKRKGANGPFQILNVALLTEKKGQADLIRAFAGQFASDADVQLRIGGDGPIRSKLERLTADLGVNDKVVFLGMLSRDEVRKEMQACDAFALPSHYETFGIVLIEALACGKPVVATRCGGPECIVHDGNGLLVPVHDEIALGNAMSTLRLSLSRYDPEVIRNDCIARFGPRTVIDQLTSLYQKVRHLSECSPYCGCKKHRL
ncbi:MAG: glycosyltransferase [Deltaproteobacteria bacterium]|nr:glycosyltransferase [Deltaproteobacteria bacterium]